MENQDYGVAEIQAIEQAIKFIHFNTFPNQSNMDVVGLIENLESAILAIQTHVLPESHPMAVN